MSARSAAEVAFVDQHVAGLRDELVEHADVMAHLGMSRYPRRPSRALLARYADELLHRGVRTCPHLGPGRPGPTWTAADDLALRCAACITRHLRRPAPLPEGCDLCGQDAQLRAVAVVAAPMPARTRDGRSCRVPTTVLLAGVCSACWAAPAAVT